MMRAAHLLIDGEPKIFSKIAVVAGGYIAAFLVAATAVAIRIANTSGPDAQASSGMYAFGDALLFVAVFGVSALGPTGAALSSSGPIVASGPCSRHWVSRWRSRGSRR